MAKQKSKAKFLSPDVSEYSALHSSPSDISSIETRSERSIPVSIVTEALKPGSEVLKRHRHYQEFKKIYYSRLNKNKHGNRKYDSHAKWNDAVSSFRKKDSADRNPLPRMTSSKVTHRRSERSYVEKVLNRFQKPSYTSRGSCESVKLMYSAFSSVESQESNRSRNRHQSALKYDIEKRHKSAERARHTEDRRDVERKRHRSRNDRERVDHRKEVAAIRDKYEKSPRDRYRNYSLETIESSEKDTECDSHKKERRTSINEDLSLEEEYYEKYQKQPEKRKESGQSLSKHRDYDRHKDSGSEYEQSRYKREKYERYHDYDDDKYDKKHRSYENYEKYKYRNLNARDAHRSDRHHAVEEERSHHKRREIEKQDKYDTSDKYYRQDKYNKEHYNRYDKIEKDHARQKRSGREDDRGREESHHNVTKRRSKSGKHKYDEADCEMIERLERFILEQRLENYAKHKYLKDRHGEKSNWPSGRDVSNHCLALEKRTPSYTSQQEVYEKRSLHDLHSRLGSNEEIEICSRDVEKPPSLGNIPVKVISRKANKSKVDEHTHMDLLSQPKTEEQTEIQCEGKLLVEQESQCVEIEKKSQASETKMPRGVSFVKPTKQKLEKKAEPKNDTKYSKQIERSKSPDKVETASNAEMKTTNLFSAKKRQTLTKRESTDPLKTKRIRTKQNEMETPKENELPTGQDALQTVREQYLLDLFGNTEASSSLLSTLSQMEERALKTLQTLKDAERKIIEERINEINAPSKERKIQEELEKHLKVIEEVTSAQLKICQNERSENTDSKKDAILEGEVIPQTADNLNEKCQLELACNLLMFKLQKLKNHQNLKLQKNVKSDSREESIGSASPTSTISSFENLETQNGHMEESKEQYLNVRYLAKDDISDDQIDRTAQIQFQNQEYVNEVETKSPKEERRDNDEMRHKLLEEIGHFEETTRNTERKTSAVQNALNTPSKTKEENVAERKVSWKDKINEIEQEKSFGDKDVEENRKRDKHTIDKHEGNIDNTILPKKESDSECMRIDTIPERKVELKVENLQDTKDSRSNEVKDYINEEKVKVPADEGKAFIKEPMLATSSGSMTATPCSVGSNQKLECAPIVFVSSGSIPIHHTSKSRLPVRIKTTTSMITPGSKVRSVLETKSYHEEFNSYAEKLLNIYRTNTHESEELVEKLKMVVNLQKTPDPSQPSVIASEKKPRKTSVERKPLIERESAFQKMKKMLRPDKKKTDKKPQSSRKKIFVVKTVKKVQEKPLLSPEQKTLQDAIDLFNLHKSTLSVVHGEINQLEEKINGLLEKRSEKPKRNKSKIPKRIS